MHAIDVVSLTVFADAILDYIEIQSNWIIVVNNNRRIDRCLYFRRRKSSNHRTQNARNWDGWNGEKSLAGIKMRKSWCDVNRTLWQCILPNGMSTIWVIKYIRKNRLIFLAHSCQFYLVQSKSTQWVWLIFLEVSNSSLEHSLWHSVESFWRGIDSIRPEASDSVERQFIAISTRQ